MKKTHFFDMFLSYVDPIDMSKGYVEIFHFFIHKKILDVQTPERQDNELGDSL